jgi:glycine betaine/proline transport system substrate-binding protein
LTPPGDGKADLPAATLVSCEGRDRAPLTAFGLRDTVLPWQGTYSALIADNSSPAFQKGQPASHTWTLYSVSGVLRPGKDVVWLEVPFKSPPGEQSKLDNRHQRQELRSR